MLEFQLTVYLKKTVSFAGDGASVMCGKKTGLVARLKQEQPHLVGVHYVAHRLELSYKDVFKQTEVFKDLDRLLLDLYYFYEKSPLNRANLSNAQKA